MEHMDYKHGYFDEGGNRARRYHATKQPNAPTITSIVPSMLVRVIGKVKNGSGVDPNNGKKNRSLNSHNMPPIRRNPSNLISKSTRLEFLCLNFLLSNLSKAVELAVLLASSDKTKPNRKCSSISSSATIGCNPQGNRRSTKTTVNSKKPTETSLLSNKIDLTIFHISFSRLTKFNWRVSRMRSLRRPVKLLARAFFEGYLFVPLCTKRLFHPNA